MNRIVVSGFLTGALLLGLTACSKSQDSTSSQASAQAPAGDPANGNLAVSDQTQSPPDQSASNAPAPTYAAGQNNEPAPAADNSYADASYDASNGQPVYATEPPPPLPEYEQPPCPGDDYIWTPGYWGWQNAGYYWVPGVWVTAPYVDALWTPPYWGFADGRYAWHSGYWGPHIGFYGGINYGFGYTGHGYQGAYWNNGAVYYNRSVTNVNTTVVRNVYNYSVPSASNTRISYNGGRGGINARPLPAEQAALREPHAAPVAAQVQHSRQAAGNREQFAAVNRGRPQVAAAAAPLATPYRTPAPRPAAVAQVLARQTPRPGEPAAQPGRPEVNQRTEANQPNRPAPAAPENKMAARQPQAPAPAPAARQPFENRETRQPAPVARQAIPENRPAPQPAPVTRQPIPQNRPAPAQPQQRVEARPAPQPAARPAPAPRPEARPAPQPVARPAAPAPRPEARPAQPAARPAPAAARPAPAPPAAKPAPRPEEGKEKGR